MERLHALHENGGVLLDSLKAEVEEARKGTI